MWSSPKSWASCDQSTGWSTKHFSVFVTGVSPGSTCICSSSLLKQPCKPPEGLPPSVSLGPSTEHSRGWTASGDFLPLPHHLVTQTPRPRNKAGHYPLKTYETHHLPSFLSQVSQLCCKWSHMKDTHRHIHTYIWNIYTYTEFFFIHWIIYAAAAAKSLQSCLTLCNPIDGSPPGSAIPGILQARTLEWAAISFSNAWKWKVKVKSLCRFWLFATPWTAAYQAPPSMGFSRQEYWSGVPSACFKT